MVIGLRKGDNIIGFSTTIPIMETYRTKEEFNNARKMYKIANNDFLYYDEISITGNNYKEKQESCRQQIHTIQLLLAQSSQSYKTLVEVQNWITSRATTFGLLKELRESGII